MIQVLLSPWTETPRIWKEGKNVRSLYVASVEKNTRAYVWQVLYHASGAVVQVTQLDTALERIQRPKGTT